MGAQVAGWAVPMVSVVLELQSAPRGSTCTQAAVENICFSWALKRGASLGASEDTGLLGLAARGSGKQRGP